VGSSRIEVSQKCSIPQLVGLACLLQVVALGIYVIRNDQLDCALRASVWVGRANGAVLGNGNHARVLGGITVDGRGGGEDDVVDIVLLHAAEEGDGSADIDTVVFEGDLSRFTDCLG